MMQCFGWIFQFNDFFFKLRIWWMEKQLQGLLSTDFFICNFPQWLEISQMSHSPNGQTQFHNAGKNGQQSRDWNTSLTCHRIFKNVVFLLVRNALVLEKFENFCRSWTSVYQRSEWHEPSIFSCCQHCLYCFFQWWLLWHNFLGLLWVCEALNNCNASWSHDDELRHEAETQAVATTIVKKGDFVVY